MKFAEVLPGLLAGRRARLRNRPLDDGGAERMALGISMVTVTRMGPMALGIR